MHSERQATSTEQRKRQMNRSSSNGKTKSPIETEFWDLAMFT